MKAYMDSIPNDIKKRLLYTEDDNTEAMANTPDETPEEEGKGRAETYKKVFEFLSKQDAKVPDKKIHEFAMTLGLDPDDVEETIYGLLISLLSYGKSKDFKGEYDAKELAMGKQVEMEHLKGSPLKKEILEMIAEKIAKDHLAEIPDYYTRLKAMEAGAEQKPKEPAAPAQPQAPAPKPVAPPAKPMMPQPEKKNIPPAI